MIATGPDPSDAPPHPLPARLAAFGRGRLDDDESASIAGHLSACDACRTLVEAVDDDSLAGLFRRANGPSTAEVDRADSPAGYVILEVLGEGGMGVVSKARQVALGRLVALKQLRPEILAGPDGVARFRREAEAAARLRHPNIVPIHEVGWRGEVPYFSMEYVEGGTLGRRLAEGPVGPRDAARLVETLARAVQHAHESGVVHRDLKPSNVLLAPDLLHPKIGDFGLAKLDDDSTRTRSGVLLGTPDYMAPEQAQGDTSRVGPPADIHALGAILYEIVAGRPPYRAPSVLETLEQVRVAEPTPPRRLRDGVPRDLETIALKCLEKSPGRRYPTALALADDLRRHLDGEPIVARAASPPERLAKWAGRRPWQAASAALGVLLLVGALAGSLVHNARLRDEVRRTAFEADEARRQRSRAEDQYRSARTAIRRMIGRLDEPRFAGRPLGGDMGVRRRLLEDALAFYEGAVRDDASAGTSARIDKVRALREAGSFQIMLGKLDIAGQTFRRALALVAALEAEAPGDPAIVHEQIDCRLKLAITLEGTGRLDEAADIYGQAIARAERSGLGELEGGDDLAWCHHNLGSALLAANRPAAAEPHLARAAEIRRALLASHPREIHLRSRLAETLINLALAHARQQAVDRAEVEFAEAASLLGPNIRDDRDRPSSALSMGKLYLNWGWIALAAGQADRALERFREGLGPVDAVLRASPDWPEARGGSSQLNAALALALGDANRHREAVACWDRAIALGDEANARNYRLGRLASLAREGDGSDALAEAESLARGSQALTGADLYNLACVASVVAASADQSGPSDRAEAAALRALVWLGRALDAGVFRDPEILAALDRDPDLAALRPRRDFRLLRLDARFPADPFRLAR